MISNKFLFFKTEAGFNAKKAEIDLNTSIVFIKDKKRLLTHDLVISGDDAMSALVKYLPLAGGEISGTLDIKGKDAQGNGLTVVNDINTASNLAVLGDALVEGGLTAGSVSRKGGTADQILLGNGTTASLSSLKSAISAIPKFAVKVVSALPTDIAAISASAIYLVKSGTEAKNLYTEYLYTGEVGSGKTYDASKWEKLGEQKADLTPYSKKSETVKSVTIAQSASTQSLVLTVAEADGSAATATAIPVATASKNGVMSAGDKAEFNAMLDRTFPFSIATFALASSCPALQKVGANPTFSATWSYGNEAKYTITSVALDVPVGVTDIDKTLAVTDKSYKGAHAMFLGTGSVVGGDYQPGAAPHGTYTYKLRVKGKHKVSGTAFDQSKTVSVTFNHASYVGKVAADATPSASTLASLTASVEWGKGKSNTQSLSNQKFVYCYPSYFGDLTSIKDGNGFEGLAGFTKSTFTANGTTYNCYTQTIASTGSATYNFK